MGHQQRDLLQYLASIAKIEHAIQIDFFPDLPAQRFSVETVKR